MMNLDALINLLRAAGNPGDVAIVAALAKLEEARSLAELIADTADLGRPDELTNTKVRALDFLCVEWRKNEAQYCDGCACRLARGAAFAVELMPNTVGDATRGESATLCRACYWVSLRKGGAL
jgi:hypothetical protein